MAATKTSAPGDAPAPLSALFHPSPSPDPIVNLLPLLSSPGATLPDLRRAHALLLTSGAILSSRRLSHRLLRLAARISLPDALLLHSSLSRPDPASSNLLIKSLAKLHSPSAALSFFSSHFHTVGFRPCCSTFPLLIAAAKLSASLPLGESLHSLALKVGFLSQVSVLNALIHFYASSDALDDARQLFDEMPQRDRVSYNSMVDGYVKSGDFDAAERLFWETPNRSVISWSCLFNGFVRSRMCRRGIEFYHKMREHGFEPDDTTIVSLLNLYAHCKIALFGKSVHGFLIRKWLHVPVHVSSALIDLYCKCGLLDDAMALFERIEGKDLICWNTLISGFGSNGKGEEALRVFARMLDDGVKPNDITFIGVLVACAHSGSIRDARQYFEMMSSRFGIRPSFSHYWCLVDLFVRIGSPLDALKVIQGMPLESLSAVWGAVIWLARVHGDISVGELLGRRLIELEPDNSRRYVPLVNLYAAASKWDKYRELQEVMKEKKLKKLPNCTLIDLNVIVHKFSVGDGSHTEIEKLYQVLEEIAKQLKLQPCMEASNLDCVPVEQ